MDVLFALLVAATVDVADIRAVCDALEDESAREDCHHGVDLAERAEGNERPELGLDDSDSDVERPSASW